MVCEELKNDISGVREEMSDPRAEETHYDGSLWTWNDT
jgi:hypothetical protein